MFKIKNKFYWNLARDMVIIALLLFAAFSVLSWNASALTFTNTVVEEKYIKWTWDESPPFNVTVDNVVYSEYAGNSFVLTDLDANTLHTIAVNNGETTITDEQVTDESIFFNWWTFWVGLGIVFLIMSMIIGAFAIVAWFPFLFALAESMLSGRGFLFILMTGLLMVAAFFRTAMINRGER